VISKNRQTLLSFNFARWYWLKEPKEGYYGNPRGRNIVEFFDIMDKHIQQ
jgi:hypothetical protein